MRRTRVRVTAKGYGDRKGERGVVRRHQLCEDGEGIVYMVEVMNWFSRRVLCGGCRSRWIRILRGSAREPEQPAPEIFIPIRVQFTSAIFAD